VLDGLDDVVEEVLSGSGELEPDPEPPPPPPAIYGHGLQLGYERPQVWPKRHVQARPRTGSRGQFCIPVQVRPPEPEPGSDVGGAGCIAEKCQKWFPANEVVI
jgi:hypothetical protein